MFLYVHHKLKRINNILKLLHPSVTVEVDISKLWALKKKVFLYQIQYLFQYTFYSENYFIFFLIYRVCFIFLLYLFRLSVLALQFFDIYLSDFTSHVFRVKLKDWRDLFEISMHFEQNCVIGGKFLWFILVMWKILWYRWQLNPLKSFTNPL